MAYLSSKDLGFANNIPYSAHFYEVRERYLKKGSKWVLVKAETRKISSEQYGYGCDLAAVRHFNAKRKFGYTEWGRICVEFAHISPNKTEKSVSRYYTPREWQYKR